MDTPLKLYANNWKGDYEGYISDKFIECACITSPFSQTNFIKLNTLMPDCVRAFDFGSREELIDYLRTEAKYVGDPIPDWVWE